MNDWKEWLDNKIYLLTTPVGLGVAIVRLVTGMLIGKLILSVGYTCLKILYFYF